MLNCYFYVCKWIFIKKIVYYLVVDINNILCYIKKYLFVLSILIFIDFFDNLVKICKE